MRALSQLAGRDFSLIMKGLSLSRRAVRMARFTFNARSEHHGGSRNFVGTMYGNALLVAEEAQTILNEQGHSATVFEDPEPADWNLHIKIKICAGGDIDDRAGRFTGQYCAVVSVHS